MTVLYTVFSIVKKHRGTFIVLCIALGGVLATSMAAKRFMPDLRVAVSMGHGVLAPRWISFVRSL